MVETCRICGDDPNENGGRCIIRKGKLVCHKCLRERIDPVRSARAAHNWQRDSLEQRKERLTKLAADIRVKAEINRARDQTRSIAERECKTELRQMSFLRRLWLLFSPDSEWTRAA